MRLAGQTIQQEVHRIVFQAYVETVRTAKERRDAQNELLRTKLDKDGGDLLRMAATLALLRSMLTQ